jgi:two-component system sensor histidine kinase DesK
MIVRLGPPGFAALCGLAWLCLPIPELFEQGNADPTERVAVLVAVAAFGVYVIALLLHDDEDVRPTPAQAARLAAFPALIDVGIALLGRDEWIPVMSVFVAVILTPAVRGPAQAAVIAVTAAVATGLTLAIGTDPGEAFYDASIMLTIGGTVAAVGALTRANQELQAARAELARVAVADERRRFARDLHDLLGHSLSLIAIKARLAQRVQHSDPARATQELLDIESAARTSLTEVRETVGGYRRATIATELAGVRAALESAGVALDARITRMDLDAEDEAVLAWALREATTNVVRHAGARNVVVRIEPVGDGARLQVDDDGRGGAAAGGGNGLRGLAERVAARDGRLETGGGEAGGFRLAVELPGTVAP